MLQNASKLGNPPLQALRNSAMAGKSMHSAERDGGGEYLGILRGRWRLLRFLAQPCQQLQGVLRSSRWRSCPSCVCVLGGGELLSF